MKLTDEEISSKLACLSADESIVSNDEGNNHDDGYLEGFERGAKWARDKACDIESMGEEEIQNHPLYLRGFEDAANRF